MTGHRTVLSRTAAWGLLLLLVSIPLWQFVLPAVEEYRLLRDSVEMKQRLATRLLRAGRDLAWSQKQQAQTGHVTRDAGLLLNSTRSSRADTEIRDYLTQTMRSSGGRMRSSQSLVVRPDGLLHSHSLRASITVTLPQLTDLLYRLESQRPLLFVDGLQIQAPGGRRTAATEGQPLNVQLTVMGYAISEAPQ